MKNKHQVNPSMQNENYFQGPSIDDLERILKKIEELDLKLEGKSVDSSDNKQAA